MRLQNAKDEAQTEKYETFFSNNFDFYVARAKHKKLFCRSFRCSFSHDSLSLPSFSFFTQYKTIS